MLTVKDSHNKQVNMLLMSKGIKIDCVKFTWGKKNPG